MSDRTANRDVLWVKTEDLRPGDVAQSAHGDAVLTRIQEDGSSLRLSWSAGTGETFESVITENERGDHVALIRRGDQTTRNVQQGDPPPAPVPAERCGCGHTKRDHSDRRDHKPSRIVPRRPWCHGCSVPCDYAPSPTQSAHLDGCSADEDPDGETMCACASIEKERAAYDPREEEECTPEFIDGHYIGCGVCEACR